MMVAMQPDELAEFDVTEDEFDAMLAEGEPVEVTGPFDPVRRVRIELVSGGMSTYRWRIVAANGEIMATSAASYRSGDAARRAAASIVTAMRTAPVVGVDSDDDPVGHRQAS
jgi:uncharacterized protein YegP (UPF0339 family)